MKRAWLTLALAVVAFATAHAGQSAEDWFRNDYAAQWGHKPWDNVDAIIASYTDTYTYHESDGSDRVNNPGRDMGNNIDTWRSEGWLGSDLATLTIDELNAGTVAFKAKWRNFYTDGSEDFECGWYMVRRAADSWHITAYADIDCAAQGL